VLDPDGGYGQFGNAPADCETRGRTWQVSGKLGAAGLVNGARDLLVETLRALAFRSLALPGDEDSIRRILVFRVGNIGDIVAATPTLGAIRQRFSNSYISLLTSPGAQGAPGAQELIRPGTLVDSLMVYHKSDISTWGGRKRLLRRVRSERFDLFIELSNVLAPFRQVMQSMMLARLAGCRYAAGFQVCASRWFPRTQALHVPFERESDRLFKTLGRALDLRRNDSGRLPVSEADHAFVQELLQRNGVSTNDRIVVLHVGAKRAANRWFEDRYAAVAGWIQTQPGIRVVLTGAPSERESIDQVRLHMRTQPVIACGQLNLLQTAALLERACLYVGNDTGPMHMAAAMGTPAVAIFSARDFPRQWYPYGDEHIVLRRDVPCSPCFKDVCDRGLVCLDLIQIDDVLRAVQVQLSRGKPEPPNGQAGAGERISPGPKAATDLL